MNHRLHITSAWPLPARSSLRPSNALQPSGLAAVTSAPTAPNVRPPQVIGIAPTPEAAPKDVRHYDAPLQRPALLSDLVFRRRNAQQYAVTEEDKHSRGDQKVQDTRLRSIGANSSTGGDDDCCPSNDKGTDEKNADSNVAPRRVEPKTGGGTPVPDSQTEKPRTTVPDVGPPAK